MRMLAIAAAVALLAATAQAEVVIVPAPAHRPGPLVTHERLTFAPGAFVNVGQRGGPTIASRGWLGFYWPLAIRVTPSIGIVTPWQSFSYREWHGRDGGYWNRTQRRAPRVPLYVYYRYDCP